MYAEKFNIFAGQEADDFFKERSRKLAETIDREREDYILKVNEQEYVEHLLGQFNLEPLELHADKVEAEVVERDVEVRRSPEFYGRGSTHTRRAQVAIYHVPFTGSPDLFRLIPNPRLMWSTEVWVDQGNLCFEVITFDANARQAKDEAQRILDNITKQLGHLTAQFTSRSEEFARRVPLLVRRRKDELMKKAQMAQSLGVPIRKREGLPQTFAVPFPAKKKIIAPKPEVTSGAYKVEPTLDQGIYEDILRTVHDFGKQLERMPSTYKGKGETDLRDLLLMTLEPRYEKTSATGETFNKSGKTDILVRHEKSNIFVAELGVWDGPKGLLDKLTQLLGYLTWRDSKAALVVFVRNKEFTPVLKQIEEALPKHPTFLRSVERRDETWFTYRVCLQGDRDREIQLAVLAFHLPQ